MSDPRKQFRRLVSLQKKRFQNEDFDLDLAYITDNIIAFGFPAEGRESVFRNPMAECQRFFEKYHKDKYYIYNLCIEKDRQYKAKKFKDRVGKYQWHDHNAPPLEMIPEFCKHAADWLEKDKENIVAIHCKAGKGRTGVLICCLLLYLKSFPDPEAAMEFYGKQRTHNGKGVTIPSQKRFIRYYFRTLTEGVPPKHEVALLKKITFNKLPMVEDLNFSVLIESNGTVVKHLSKGDKGIKYTFSISDMEIDLGIIPVSGNTRIMLFHPKKKEGELFHFWFHCHYIQGDLVLQKNEIDKAISDKTHKIFPEDFSIVVHFESTGDIYEQPPIVEENKVEQPSEDDAKHTSSCSSAEEESEEEDSEDFSNALLSFSKSDAGNAEEIKSIPEEVEQKEEKAENKEEKPEEKEEPKVEKQEKEEKEEKEEEEEEKVEEEVKESKSDEKQEEPKKKGDKKTQAGLKPTRRSSLLAIPISVFRSGSTEKKRSSTLSKTASGIEEKGKRG